MIVIKFFRMAPFFAKSRVNYALELNNILGMSVTGSKSVGGFRSRGRQFCRKCDNLQKVAQNFIKTSVFTVVGYTVLRFST